MKKEQTYFIAESINPFNNNMARAFYHKTEECPLLKNWKGAITAYPKVIAFHRKRCPFCFDPNVLEKATNGYRAYLRLEETFLYNYLNSFLEGVKTKAELLEEIEHF